MTATSTLEGVAFDRVVMTDAAGRRELGVEEFLSLPLSVRIRCVLAREAAFFLGAVEVDRKRALDSLRRARAAG
ncbi:MAG: hypothetical protein IT374_15320 [Polyangiaceae bacterium]|nr:hypothetical protein [Polyangiaceae bacterium]